MKFLYALIVLLLCTSVNVFSQQLLKGKVIDAATGKPLVSANIVYGRQGVVTQSDGSFSIECGKANTISISFAGYEAQKKTITDCNKEILIALSAVNLVLDEVEITATSNPNRQLLYQPASISKLSTVELKRGTGLFFDDAIQTNVPGMTMNRRTVSGGQQFNIRGYGNGARGTRGISSNFDGQGYKVYLNGIPVTDAEGITTMDDIDFGSIGNVEVVKGPSGTLYGLAIAGAVNLKTITPQKGKTAVGQEVILGNYGLQRYTTIFQTASEHSAILVNYGHQKSNGFSIHNKSTKDFINVTGEFNPNQKQTINTYAGYSNSYDERFGELTLQQWSNNDYSGNPEYIKRDAHSNVITFRAGAGHTYLFTKNISNTTTIFGTGFNSNASSAGGFTDKTTLNYGLRSTVDTRFTLQQGITLSGITGVETQRQHGQIIGYSMKQNPADTATIWTYGVSPYWVINTATSNVATITKTTSLFTEWTLSLPYKVSAGAGIGASNMGITLNDRFNAALPTRPSKFDTTYKYMLAPHFTLNKVFSTKMSVYVSYSKAYKAPVSSYFYITTPAVNTTPPTPATGRVNGVLKPETARQFEAGTKGNLLKGMLYYELTCFNIEYANKMTAVSVSSPTAPNTTLYSYMVNGGKQKHNGVEALARFTIQPKGNYFIKLLRPFANATYSNFKYGNNFTIQKSVTLTEDYSSKKVAGVSKIIANAGIDMQFSYGLYANVNYNYRDPTPITSVNNIYTSSYNLLNGKIGWQHALGRHFNADAYLGATNITNTKYYYMVFANQLPDAYVPAPKHAIIFGGVNLQYNF
jgi:iron complex outermembrane recepter protein